MGKKASEYFSRSLHQQTLQLEIMHTQITHTMLQVMLSACVSNNYTSVTNTKSDNKNNKKASNTVTTHLD